MADDDDHDLRHLLIASWPGGRTVRPPGHPEGLSVDTSFLCTETFMVRAAVLPRRAAMVTRAAPVTIDALLADPAAGPFVEAVSLASRSLADTITRVAGGHPLSPRRAGRASESLTRYLLRMTGRATPFGLMAGVASGSFGDEPSIRFGPDHRRVARPDHGWLARLTSALEAEPAVIERCVVVADDLVRNEGARVVQPFGGGASGIVRRSMRRTALVAAILAHTTRPVAATELADRLAREFPGAPRGRVVGLITAMVGSGFLRTSLRPAWSGDDPLAVLEAALPGHGAVKAARHAFDAYQDSAAGWRGAALAGVREVAGGEAVQVDLRLDLDVVLPREVAREAERAVEVLHRLALPQTPRVRAMAGYHARFVDRYGLGCAVPLTDVIDPDAGLGFPDGYAGPRGNQPEIDDTARQDELARLLVESTLRGGDEVVLDDDLVDRLHRPGGVPPASVDLFATLIAEDAVALRDGGFTLIVSSLTGTQQAGAASARFGHLPGFGSVVAELAGESRAGRAGPLRVELSHAVIPPRYRNLMPPARTLPTALAVGVPPEAELDLRLDDVAIVADSRRLRLWSFSRNRELDVVVPHVLDTDSVAPDSVRLLRDVTLMGLRTLKGWSWGALSGAPFLPAVRYGRTVLSQARWRARPEDVVDDAAFGRWRARLRVPRHVRLARVDHRLGLDLDSAVHRGILRNAARAAAVDVVAEPVPDLDHGWLRGHDGAHESELVLSLRSRRAGTAAEHAGPVVHAAMSPALPGGAWLNARIPCDTPRQREVLTHHVLPWMAIARRHADRWFFVRYVDERGAAELRIRLHGDPEVLHGEVLHGLHELVTRLIDAGLAGELALVPYYPEAGRYGGPALMALAERVFTADSRLVLRRLGGDDRPTAVARDVVALVRHFHAGVGGDGIAWLLSRCRDGHAERRLFAGHRAAALAAVAPDRDLTDGVEEDEQEWGLLLAEYGEGLAPADRDTALAALLHMHCNRRLGPDLDGEQLVYALAAGAVRAHRARAAAAR